MRFSELPSHHALLITHGDRTTYGNALWEELRKISPAHRHFNQTVLDIETAREIISFAQSPYSGEKVGLISFHTASLPAQNAMLKVLEEPRPNMRFILLTTNKNTLIPTVLSRVQHIVVSDKRQTTGDRHEEAHADEFLLTSPTYRIKLSFIVELLSKMDEEGRKDREAIKNFILCLAEKLSEKKVESRFIIETLEMASYASDPSASGKALLEYLSLLLPTIK